VTRICVFGLGEAGGAIAGDLVAAGADVHGYDPADVATPAGVVRHDDPRDAAIGADLVLAITAAADAPTALTQAVDVVSPQATYADLSTASAGLKHQLADIAGKAGFAFVDVALMAPVPGNGLHTPALASGTAAHGFVATMRRLGMPVDHAGDEPGLAATRKLLRSVVMKGLAALVIESLRAAEAAGVATETWDNVVAQITAADGPFLRRLLAGTAAHARRRLHEMDATIDLLTDLGIDPVMTRGTAAGLRAIADRAADVPDPPGGHAPGAM
jgi:3-hydroxyisobutyrate dehydrogenase-like beta-hydroxyacid dehydrogenase